MQCGHPGRVRVLYKSILRLHRGLPEELKLLGDNYARDEFRRHKSCSDQEAATFMNEWTNYALSLAGQLGLKGPVTTHAFGNQLDETTLNSMTDEQVCQLYELMLTAKGENEDPQKQTSI